MGMEKSASTPRSFWLTLLTFTIIVNLTMMRSTYLHLLDIKANLMHSAWSGMLVLCFIIIMACIWLLIRGAKVNYGRLDNIQFNSAVWHGFGVLVFLAILFIIPYVKFKYNIGQNIKNPIYADVVNHLFEYVRTYLTSECEAGLKQKLEKGYLK